MTTLLAVLIIVDFMFLDDSQFVFDPDVKARIATRAGRGGYLTRCTILPIFLFRLLVCASLLQNWARRTQPTY